MTRTYVETSADLLEQVDEMIREGFYHDRTEAVNEALALLIKRYKVSKLHAKDRRLAGAEQPSKAESGDSGVDAGSGPDGEQQ